MCFVGCKDTRMVWYVSSCIKVPLAVSGAGIFVFYSNLPTSLISSTSLLTNFISNLIILKDTKRPPISQYHFANKSHHFEKQNARQFVPSTILLANLSIPKHKTRAPFFQYYFASNFHHSEAHNARQFSHNHFTSKSHHSEPQNARQFVQYYFAC